jgi:hypothetical protein
MRVWLGFFFALDAYADLSWIVWTNNKRHAMPLFMNDEEDARRFARLFFFVFCCWCGLVLTCLDQQQKTLFFLFFLLLMWTCPELSGPSTKGKGKGAYSTKAKILLDCWLALWVDAAGKEIVGLLIGFVSQCCRQRDCWIVDWLCESMLLTRWDRRGICFYPDILYIAALSYSAEENILLFDRPCAICMHIITSAV